MYNRKSDIFIKLGDLLFTAVRKILCFSLIGAMLTGCAGDEQTPLPTESNSSRSVQSTDGIHTSDLNDDPAAQDVLEVRFLKVGKADAIVLMCGKETMLIDCGEEDDGKEVLSLLKNRGIKEVDVLMITHFDKDHVGGADTVLLEIPVKRVLLPAYAGSGTEYTDFMAAMNKAGITPENVTENVRLTLGNASLLVEPPASYEIPANTNEYDNDFSLITTVESCGKRFLFTGDIEKQRIREWISNGSASKCDVLKIPHHGVYNKALADLLRVTSPTYTVICDSKKNPADERTLELIRKIGADCKQTQYGDVIIRCSREGIEINQ